MSRQQVQHIVSEVALGTLANLTAIAIALTPDASREQGARIKQLKLAISYKGKTAGEGPLIVGLCDSNLSVAEIAEAILADPQHVADVPATEQGNRRVFPIWIIPAGLTADDRIQKTEEVHYPWKDMEESQGLKFWVFNADGNALTTGTEVTVDGSIVGEWLHD